MALFLRKIQATQAGSCFSTISSFKLELDSFIYSSNFDFNTKSIFHPFIKLDRGPPRTMGIVHFHKVFKGFWLLVIGDVVLVTAPQ